MGGIRFEWGKSGRVCCDLSALLYLLGGTELLVLSLQLGPLSRSGAVLPVFTLLVSYPERLELCYLHPQLVLKAFHQLPCRGESPVQPGPGCCPDYTRLPQSIHVKHQQFPDQMGLM